jgi:N-acetylneuraminate lyase
MEKHFTGLIAAVFTPMCEDGSLNLNQVPPIVEHLIKTQVSGIFVCGTTGEGPSLSSEERRATAAAYAEAAAGRLPVIVQVGHNSLAESRALASHAQAIGVDAISATPPAYFKFEEINTLVDCLAEISSAAPKLPLFYYHIPSMTGMDFDIVEFLRQASEHFPRLAGIKFSDSAIPKFQAAVEFENRRFDVLFGSDEMLLSGLCAGAAGAVGSTYNFAGPLYRQIIDAFDRGDIDEARRCQGLSVEMVRILRRYRIQSALKATMKLIGVDCGPSRLPLATLTDDESQAMKKELDGIGFFDWAMPKE